jgi:micrococcal nuclease
MVRRRRALVVSCLAIAVLGSCTTPGGSAPGHDADAGRDLVTRVVDGDTAHVEIDGRDVTVRFIGIDTPESVAPDQPVECYGREASAYTRDRLEDRYGRTLAYVWLGDELINETLVRQGYALVTTFPPNVEYVGRFTAAQRDAREHGRGLCDACG